MKKINVCGGKPLFGCVDVNGSKNAALPMIFAAVACHGTSVIDNFPYIGDTKIALDIISSFGASVRLEGKRLYIDASDLSYKPPEKQLTCKIRASTYLIGACLSRFGVVDLIDYGGCNFAARPIDIHIFAAESLGADRKGNRLTVKKLSGGVIKLPKPSVGATVNTLILASSASGVTEIHGAAREPHVCSLINYLRSMGAKIETEKDVIKVTGCCLSSGESRVIGDMIEAATYLIAGVCTHGEVAVNGIDTDTLGSLFDLLSEMGADVFLTQNKATIKADKGLKSVKAVAEPYPGLPTDIQPLLAPLFAVGSGGIITDRVFPNRFGYLKELEAFGICSEPINDGVRIFSSQLHCANVSAPDLRGGAACLISALAAEGRSVMDSAEILLRGYENPDRVLNKLGAHVSLE